MKQGKDVFSGRKGSDEKPGSAAAGRTLPWQQPYRSAVVRASSGLLKKVGKGWGKGSGGDGPDDLFNLGLERRRGNDNDVAIRHRCFEPGF